VTLGGGAPVLPRRLVGVLQLVEARPVNGAMVKAHYRLRR
jgi:hypothetical protein